MECMPYDFKRARALQTSFYLLGRHRDAMRLSMAQKEAIGASVLACEA
jgi:hypothetical protein